MTKKAKPAKKRAYNKKTARIDISTKLEPFEIEVSPPPATYKGNNIEALVVFRRIDQTISSLKPGQAFIIPSDREATVRRYLRMSYADRNFLFNKVVGNDKVYRVYFTRYVNEPKSKK